MCLPLPVSTFTDLLACHPISSRRSTRTLIAALNHPDTRNKLLTYGVNIVPSSPEELAKIQIAEMKMWEEPVKASGYTGD